MFATDQFFKRVDIGELKQEYVMEDTTWNIQKTVVDLNTGEILPPVEKKEKFLITDQLLEKIQFFKFNYCFILLMKGVTYFSMKLERERKNECFNQFRFSRKTFKCIIRRESCHT